MSETYRLVFVMPQTRLVGLPPLRNIALRNLEFEEAKRLQSWIVDAIEKHPLARYSRGDVRIEIEVQSPAEWF